MQNRATFYLFFYCQPKTSPKDLNPLSQHVHWKLSGFQLIFCVPDTRILRSHTLGLMSVIFRCCLQFLSLL